VVARQILEREEGDGITMDCLGALGRTKVSLPCIAWSKMLDQGIPAACEADLGASVTHALVQWLFDRPGFEQDPVPETAKECLIGAHCTCPTRLKGFDQPPEPYDLTHHHGKRDAVPRPVWRKGQRVTIADVLLTGEKELTPARTDSAPQMLISTGTVVDNIPVPPAGGCVVSVMVKLDTQPELLTYPGFHQIFFYGEYRKELVAYCRLFGLQPVVV
jgi:L-fucose isomerase-like protein